MKYTSLLRKYSQTTSLKAIRKAFKTFISFNEFCFIIYINIKSHIPLFTMIYCFLSPVKKSLRWFLWVDLGSSLLLSRQISYIFRILATLVELYFGLLVTVGNFMHQLKILEIYIQECDFVMDPQNSTVFLNKLSKIFFRFLGGIKLIFCTGIKNKVSITLNFNNVNHSWWMWPGMPKVPKITILQYLCNISRKSWGITVFFASR